jgi:hypothetical protein
VNRTAVGLGPKNSAHGQKIALTAIVDQTNNLPFARTLGQAACRQFCRIDFGDRCAPAVTEEREMIEFLTDMPTNTKIFLTVAVLGLAATLVVLRRLL